jgi:hypothetical protein
MAFAVCFSIVVAASACQDAATNKAVNANAANTNGAVNQNANKPVENKAEPANTGDTGSTGSLATPTEAYKTAYEIRKRKDAAGLKKVMSKDVLEFFEEMGKIEKKSLDDMLKELVEKPQGPTNETRNEKITGNRAILEYKNEKGEWKEMDFEKEGSEWKMTIPKADGPGTDGPQKKP